jgi:putative ABC transport system permease protein
MRLWSFWVLAADAAASLLRRPWHAIGMMSGIMLGVASASAAVVIADTQQGQIDLRFDLQRSNHVVVQAENPSRDGFAAEQVRLVAGLEPVSSVGEFSNWSEGEPVTRSIASTTATVPVLVADRGGIEASATTVISGASADLLEDPEHTSIAWVGKELANDLGVAPADGRSFADSRIVVRGHPFSVAGIVANDGGFGYVENSVILSRAAAVSTVGGNGRNVRLVAQVRPGSAAAVADYTVRTVGGGGGLTLVDRTPPDGKELLGDVGGDLRRVGTALGAFVGLVGLIAIANTLMMSVHQRQRELGLRSAMGWSRRRIGLLVLTESGIAGLTAGILGAAVGLASAAGWCWLHGWTLIMPTVLPGVVVGGGIAASLIGGLLPALRAASISPLTAMRS